MSFPILTMFISLCTVVACVAAPVPRPVADATPTTLAELRFISNAKRLHLGLPLLKPTRRQNTPPTRGMPSGSPRGGRR
ncbi:hypothetical protein DFH06DRAFT_1312746 [Mycena polygramma]|nr:hypothetical protein DFH06DRAFT_1312746 [Mycena polygramma]